MSQESLEALARAYDREDAAQRGEPTPWDDVEDLTWRAERIACAQVGLAAYLASSPEGRQEAAVLDVVEEMKWFDNRGGLAIGMHEALRRWIATLSALPAPVAAVAPAMKDLQARLWNASGELAAHGGFDNHWRTLNEAAAALSLIPAKPAVESICSNCSGKGTEPGYVNDDGPPVDIKCEICGGAKPAVEVVEALNAPELIERLRGPVFGTPTALAAAAAIETWKARAERLADMHRDMCVVAGEAIARAERAEAALQAPATPDAQPEGYAVCMWVDKPCTCGGGPCEQVSFGAGEPATPDAQTEVEK